MPIPNFKRVPINFLSNREKDISHLSELLLSTVVTQRLLDHTYEHFCNILHTEILHSIPTKRFQKYNESPWWNLSLAKARKKAQRLQRFWLKYKRIKEVELSLRINFRTAHHN